MSTGDTETKGWLCNFQSSRWIKTEWRWHCTPVSVSHWVREGDGTPLQYSCLENPTDGGAWWAAVHGVAKSQILTEWLHFHFSLSCTGKENGNPLQCSCLENPRDGGAWWAVVYGVAQSRNDWSDLAAAAAAAVAQFCPVLCKPMDCSLPGSSVHGILQVRILEWVVISFLQGIFCIQGSNPVLLYGRWILYFLSHQGKLWQRSPEFRM